ncbi:uncharacterized protein LOC143374363 isoform X2 [Andrena cerasifolii]|uniref:uncharacterized protein LOC143374363 isoform X2 n=1 Tax=Andrena cerasifolii TaxID=2819439 RepID=UPI004037A5B4
MSTLELQELCNIIKRFKFEELESAVIPHFPETSWAKIRSELVKHHWQFTTANTVSLIKLAITAAKVPQKVLRDRLSLLKLIDISWHSKRRAWYGYALVGPNKSKNYLISRRIQDDIKEHFHALNIKMDVNVNTHDDVMYVSLKENRSKGRKKKIPNVAPIYFALFIGQKYFFCTKKNIPSDILEGILKNMGYNSSKKLNLMGKDLKSLSKLCWKKKEGALSSENINKSLIYKDGSPDKKPTGTDFTQHKQRKKYAEMCFGDDPPTLELLVINGPSIPLIQKDVSLKLPNESIRATWEFRSRNICICLTKLIERRILATPVPYYISNLMVLGKNKFTIRND